MIATLICLVAMLILQLLTPFWWWIMIVPLAYGAAAAKTGWRAFRTGLLSAGLLWLGASTYLYLFGSRLIATRMARMFGLGDSWLMVLTTAVIAAVAAAIAGYAGYAVRELFKKRKKKGS